MSDQTSEGLVQRDTCFVFVYLPGTVEAVLAGKLTIAQFGREYLSSFGYGESYLRRPDAVALDPAELPLQSSSGSVFVPPKGNMFFGVFRDSSPDAWGRLTIKDRFLEELGDQGEVEAEALELLEMEYLLRSRPDRVGALDFRENKTDGEPPKKIAEVINLRTLMCEAQRIREGKPADKEIQTLLHPGTGMGGARPKTTIEDDGALWLAKFPLENERMERTRMEHAMLNLALICGISTIEHRLVEIDGLDSPVFLIQRFDRQASQAHPGHYERQGYISALTALGLEEHLQQEGSYQMLATFLQRAGAPDRHLPQRRELFRRMVLNALINNEDDHLRNHGLLRDPESRYYDLSPVFDLEPRPMIRGVGTNRRLAINLGRNGRDVTVRNILSDVEPFGLTMEEAQVHLADMATLVRDHWIECCNAAGVSPKDIAAMEETMSFCDRVLSELDPEAAHRERAERET